MVSPASPEFQERLDAHVREMVAFHFSDETGSPFWLDFKKKLDFDPRDRIRGFADLSCLGFFQDEWLRCREPRVFVPKAFKDKPIYVFETGGSTGIPKSRINIEDFRLDYTAFSATLPDKFFPKGADWLDARALRARAGCGSPSSTSPRSAAASATWSISTRVS